MMLGNTFALAIGASLLAGLLPAWRACRIAPALQLKAN
jgi:putative ABC transport system permease protein